jgi:hypothetical protein
MSLAPGMADDFLHNIWANHLPPQAHQATIIASKDPKMSKRAAVGKRKHTILPTAQKL